MTSSFRKCSLKTTRALSVCGILAVAMLVWVDSVQGEIKIETVQKVPGTV